MKKYNSFYPGNEWLDTAGKPIQAHGFHIFFDKNLNEYCWVGANHEFSHAGGTVWANGVKLYTSTDLYNWTDRGIIIPPSDDLSNPLHSTYKMDRPHILYCEKTGKYIAWVHIIDNGQFVVILQADNILGPYTMVKPCYYPLNMGIGDFSFHYDETAKKQYIFFNRAHYELVCAELTDDYTAVTENYSVHLSGKIPPFTREAPVFTEHNGKKYLFTSGTTGYHPNQTIVHTMDDYHGEYKELCDPFVNDKNKISFNSQISCILKPNGKDCYIACADRWITDDDVAKQAKRVHDYFIANSDEFAFDDSPKYPYPMPGKLQINDADTYKSRYVWLPITFEFDIPKICWKDEWKYK